MRHPELVTVRVPASTSNLGPGYDCLGLAFRIYNKFEVSVLPPGQHKFSVEGPEKIKLSNGSDNLFVQAAHRFHREWKESGKVASRAPGFCVRATLNIPAVRGLGSSSTAVLAGLAAANAYAGLPFGREQLLNVAGRMEGHPDNVTPSFLGGLCTGVMDPSGGILYARYRVHASVQCVLLIPDYQVSTEKARKALPAKVPHGDAVFNMTRIPLIVDRLRRGDLRELGLLMEDRLHEPYRKGLIPGFDEVVAAGRKAKAAAVVLSGAGSALVAFCERGRGDAVGRAMVRALERAGHRGRYVVPGIDYSGTRVHIGHRSRR